MNSFTQAIILGMVMAWGGGCTSMNEKEKTSADEKLKPIFGESITNEQGTIKEELFEKYFGKSFAEFKNRKKYTELDPEILKTIRDDKLVQAIADFTAAAIHEDWENETDKVPALGPGFSAAYFLGCLDYEVNNGGFNQCFYNEGRRAVELAKEGAELIGLQELGAVISKALKIEERERAKMAKVKKDRTLEAFFESYDEISFDEADEAFSELEVDIGTEMVAFIRRRPELFVGKVKGQD